MDNYKELYLFYKQQYDMLHDDESECWSCKNLEHFPQTEDSPEECGCSGCEANLFTVGGCRYYKER